MENVILLIFNFAKMDENTNTILGVYPKYYTIENLYKCKSKYEK
jgi:hypothetical protein